MHDFEPDLGHQAPISRSRKWHPFWSGGTCPMAEFADHLHHLFMGSRKQSHTRSSFISTTVLEGFLPIHLCQCDETESKLSLKQISLSFASARHEVKRSTDFSVCVTWYFHKCPRTSLQNRYDLHTCSGLF